MKNVYTAFMLMAVFSAAHAQTQQVAAQHIKELTASVNENISNETEPKKAAEDLAVSAKPFLQKLFTVTPVPGGIAGVQINKEVTTAWIWVYDMLGNCVLKEQPDSSGQYRLYLKQGNYFLLVKNGKEFQSEQLMIK